MRAAIAFSAFLALGMGVSAQTTRSFGSVVFPGGTTATTPGIVRTFGSVVFPGGSAVPVVRTPVAPLGPRSLVFAGTPLVHSGFSPIGQTFPVAGGQNFVGGGGNFPNRGGSNFKHGAGGKGNFRNNGNTNTLVYAYPVMVGGYDNSLVGGDDTAVPVPVPVPQPMPYYPQQEPARPMMIQVPQQGMSAYQPAAAQPEPETQPERYLLAFKDHTVYSAVAYWFEGDTLHYFTTGSVHNQASVSLLDRELTIRLNKELGIDFQMPAAK